MQIKADPVAWGVHPQAEEILAKRAHNTKFFRKSSRSIIAVVGSGPIHYRDSNGQWQDIKTNLIEDNAEPGYTHRVEAAGYKARFSQVSIAPQRFGVNGARVTYRAQDANVVQAIIAGSTATYPDAWSGVDLEYRLVPEGQQKQIIIKDSKQAPHSYTWQYDTIGCALQVSPGGGLQFVAAGKPVFIVPRPHMVDAAGDRSFAVTLELVGLAGNKQGIKITPDWAWVEQAALPVRIDPTTTLQPSSADSYVSEANPSSNYGSEEYLVTGWDGFNSSRALVKFDLSSLSDVGSVDAATLSLYHWSGTNESDTYYASRITGSWTEGAVTWNNQPAYTTTGQSGIVIGDGAWNLWRDWTAAGAVVSAWLVNGEPNHGFMIRGALTSGNGRTRNFRSKEYGTSAERPKLYIEYSPPSAGYHMMI